MTIRLEIERTSPLQGEITAGAGPARPFSGWVGLLAALGELVDPAPVPPHTPSPTREEA